MIALVPALPIQQDRANKVYMKMAFTEERKREWATAGVSVFCSFGALLSVGLGGDEGAMLQIRFVSNPIGS